MGETSGEMPAQTVARRAGWRRLMIAARESMSTAEHEAASARIGDFLWQLLAAEPAQTVAFCWPIRREYDCRSLVGRLLDRGWQACQPVVTAADAPMAFRSWRPGEAMTSDRHGIPIPAADRMAVPDTVLLPLVAFDDAGYRLGYGGGYFDRTLATLAARPLAIGVGFECTRLADLEPQAHDIALDAIVTEAGIRRFPHPRFAVQVSVG